MTDMFFGLSGETISIRQQTTMLTDPRSGGLASFEGRVRNHQQGKPVLKLVYEVFEPLALDEGNRILHEALKRFDIHHVRCIHRTGELAIGEAAVWIGVSAAHRDAAFQACRYVIDEVKHRLPIWKKEYYTDGSAEWINCQGCDPGSRVRHATQYCADERDSRRVCEADYYSRQICLPEVGDTGQRKLKKARILVVGAGGLGCSALQYLAAAGVGTLGVCEFDALDPSNLHRQVLYEICDAGQPKLPLAIAALRSLNPFIQIHAHAQRLDSQNVRMLFEKYDAVLDCTDVLTTKFLMSDAAVFTGTPLIQAGIYQYEGQLQVIRPDQNGPCLRCDWSAMPEADGVATCMETGVLGVVPGMFGTLQAAEALKFILGLPSPLVDHVLLMNLLDYRTLQIQRVRNIACPVCEKRVTFQALWPDALEAALSTNGNAAWEWHPSLPGGSQEQVAFEWVDVRKPWIFPVLDPQKNYLLFCERGVISRKRVQQLRNQGYENVWNLSGGLISLPKHKDKADLLS